ncbi:hypothetical protein D7Z94_24255 [Ulvibacterium marinum]|uniref:Uncharacterized protein n=1 Tax=Ulvibacterium marinum TaxID=2419782 RepID=A0A3B0BU69_9FLAO|nr:hypothetical protein D7Z94_24255 [Ulvibacterium marinum]
MGYSVFRTLVKAHNQIANRFNFFLLCEFFQGNLLKTQYLNPFQLLSAVSKLAIDLIHLKHITSIYKKETFISTNNDKTNVSTRNRIKSIKK